MADKAHLELFFERFLSFNLERYAADPTMLPLFTGLTFAQVSITDIVKTNGNTRRSSTVSSTARRFRGVNQSWTPAVAGTDLKLWKLTNTGDPLDSLSDLEAQTTPGVYSYVDGAFVKVGVVIASDVEPENYGTAVEAVLRAALVYDIPTVVFNESITDVELQGDTFEGFIAWVIGQAPTLVIPDTDYGQLEGADPTP